MYALVVEKLIWVLFAIMVLIVARMVLLSHKIAISSSSMTGSRLFGYILFNKKLDKEKEEVQKIARKVKSMFYVFLSTGLLGCLLFILAPFFS